MDNVWGMFNENDPSPIYMFDITAPDAGSAHSWNKLVRVYPHLYIEKVPSVPTA